MIRTFPRSVNTLTEKNLSTTELIGMDQEPENVTSKISGGNFIESLR